MDWRKHKLLVVLHRSHVHKKHIHWIGSKENRQLVCVKLREAEKNAHWKRENNKTNDATAAQKVDDAQVETTITTKKIYHQKCFFFQLLISFAKFLNEVVKPKWLMLITVLTIFDEIGYKNFEWN